MGEHIGGSRLALKANNELSARINGISTVDGRGEVWWYDGFEDNILKWEIGVGTAVMSTDTAESGAGSCRMTTGPGLGDLASIDKKLSIPDWSRYGGQLALYLADLSNAESLDFKIAFTWGGRQYIAEAVIDPLAGTLNINDAVLGFVTLDSSIVLPLDFTILKLVIDPANKNYLRLILNGKNYFVGKYKMNSIPSPGQQLWMQILTMNEFAGTSRVAYIDNVIVTHNEPSS